MNDELMCHGKRCTHFLKVATPEGVVKLWNCGGFCWDCMESMMARRRLR